MSSNTSRCNRCRIRQPRWLRLMLWPTKWRNIRMRKMLARRSRISFVRRILILRILTLILSANELAKEPMLSSE
jgi:hypothetical protein